ncbi:MAG: PAS domain S-box protein, partial [Candidatus Aenigmatarchaeota archaeon]
EFLGNKQGDMEVNIKNKKGEIRTLIISSASNPVHKDGKVIGTLVNARDITERKNADDAIKSSEERFRTIFEYAPDAIYINDMDGRLMDGNKKAEEMMGRKREELIGKNFVQMGMLPKSQIPKAISLLARNKLGRSTGPDDFTLISKNGGKIDVDISTYPVNIDGKKMVMGIARDASYRKLKENMLVESGRNLESAVKGSSVATFVIDKNHKVIYWNMACENLTGIAADKVVGTDKHWSAFYGKKRPVMADIIVDGSKTEHFEKYYKNMYKKSPLLENAFESERFFPELGKGGKWIFFTAAPLNDKEGNITGAIETLQDISERKMLEREKEKTFDFMKKYQAAIIKISTSENLFSGNINEIDKEITETLAKTIDVGRASIWLIDKQENALKCVDLYDKTKDVHSKGIALKTAKYPRYFKALSVGRAIDAEDAASDPRTSEFARGYFDVIGISSTLDAPIRIAGKTSGVICAEHVGEKRKWLSEEINFVAQLADQAAQAVLNYERYKAEEESQKLASVVMNSNEMVNLATPDGKMIFLNQSGMKMLGINEKDIQKTSILQVIPESCMKTVREELLPSLMAGRTWTGDLQYLNLKTGMTTDVHAMTFPIKDKKTGKILYFANVSLDINERKMLENQMKTEKEKIEEYLKIVGSVVLALDVNGNITMINKKGNDLLGYREGELIGKNWFKTCLTKEKRQGVAEVFKKIISGEMKSTEIFENDVLTKNGDTKTILWHNADIKDSSGKITGSLSSGDDVTEREKAEMILKERTEELERFNRLAVGRELKMVELKNRIEALEKKLGGSKEQK